ncbi:WxcM-like domain-containing protein [Rhodanobacter sp. DHB23]|uniref:WxcM-like domain-containing protein n=1 Tax=Rhodanobacter sp. DHB23 TaxID=2775923 RepID=UPI001786A7F8|nr:WxcM-like domain-containing protein [Rhodanobacter sp. DHB23]MBD8871244.1 WxcM-like domain-containing protein [Rhodanobacter sp. DHB23]
MNYFLHPNGLCESLHVGEGTRIWAFAHILPGAKIGNDCNICDGVFIENDVVVGNKVTIKCGVQLWDGITLKDEVFVGPNATFTNDRFPRSKAYPATFSRTVVECGASIGANATILPGLHIGRNAMVGAGAVVTHSVPPNAIVVGNPARIVGYAGAETLAPRRAAASTPAQVARPSRVRGVCTHTFNVAADLRGSLSVGEFEREIPFAVKRYFLVYDVPSMDVRGEHAHRQCHQFLIAARGSVHVVADDGRNREEFVLDRPSLGLYLPPMTWGIQYKYSTDALLLVFASHIYDPDDYIREYGVFLELVTHDGESDHSIGEQ